MATKLDKSIKRELIIDGRPFTLTITPDGLKLVEKGKRNGIEVAWRSLANGEETPARETGATAGG